MAEREAEDAQRLREQLSGDPVLRDFARPLSNFATGKADVKNTVERVARRLGKFDRAATVRFTIGGPDKSDSWMLAISPEGSRVLEGESGRPDLEVLTTADAWTKMTRGTSSPLEVFAQGNMRVRGDIGLARLIARALSRRDSG